MMISVAFLRSLVLTTGISFLLPIIPLALLFTGFSLLGYLPIVAAIAHGVTHALTDFLAVFGNGNPMQGLLIIGLTFALVGGLFDAYAFHNHYSLRRS